MLYALIVCITVVIGFTGCSTEVISPTPTTEERVSGEFSVNVYCVDTSAYTTDSLVHILYLRTELLG